MRCFICASDTSSCVSSFALLVNFWILFSISEAAMESDMSIKLSQGPTNVERELPPSPKAYLSPGPIHSEEEVERSASHLKKYEKQK